MADDDLEKGRQGAAPGGGRPLDEGRTPADGHHRRVRYSRRWFLVLAGGFVAAAAGVVQLFRWLAGGDGNGPSGGGGTRDMTGDFPVLSVEQPPDVPASQWVVVIDGLVERPLRLDPAAWGALAHVDVTADFHCVEGWSVDDVRWRGVSPRTLLDRAGARPEGTHITFHAHGGTYVDSLSVEQALEATTLLADALDGKPLPADHGGPVRLVIPTQQGYKSVKWVERLEITDRSVEGYWEQRGYPVDAPV
jgi:DMSO/TMAO reductase YedYZ molybdopterin-dependent catalytic subunit